MRATHCSIVARSCTPGINSRPSSSHAGVPLTPTSWAASIDAFTSAAPSPRSTAARDLIAVGPAARHHLGQHVGVPDVLAHDEDGLEQRLVERSERVGSLRSHDLCRAEREACVRDVLGRRERHPHGCALGSDACVHIGKPAVR